MKKSIAQAAYVAAILIIVIFAMTSCTMSSQEKAAMPVTTVCKIESISTVVVGVPWSLSEGDTIVATYKTVNGREFWIYSPATKPGKNQKFATIKRLAK